MPNVIKYNISTETRALKKGNFWIGTGDVDKGPTGTTGYWNGITPPAGGYTIYLDKATQDPSIYTAANDSELISLTNRIAGTSYTTAGECLSWFLTQTDKMIFNRDYEPIITDGLIMNLDAGFALSYPTMGTTLYDLSGKGNGGTLINGPTFSTNGGGSIHLDGVDDRIDIPKDMSGLTHNIQYDINWTVECWMYMYTPDTSPQVYKQIFGNYNGCNYDALPGNAAGFFIYDANSSSNVFCYFAFGPKNNPGGGQCPTIDFSWNNSESSWVYSSAINKWCHFVMTSDDGTNYKLFINGVQQGATKTADFKNSQLRTDNNLTSTYNYSFGGQTIGYNEVDFGIMRMYNKPLSQVEITQNYNAQKGRFGL
jgi:hypothetical protein